MPKTRGLSHGLPVALHSVLFFLVLCLANPALAQTVSFSTDKTDDTFGCG